MSGQPVQTQQEEYAGSFDAHIRGRGRGRRPDDVHARRGVAARPARAGSAHGGSACSFSIPRPAYQTRSPCQFRASADISAVGDPATDVAIYNRASAAAVVGLFIDGTLLRTQAAPPYAFATPTSLAFGTTTSRSSPRTRRTTRW
jgi:hypothetical protein